MNIGRIAYITEQYENLKYKVRRIEEAHHGDGVLTTPKHWADKEDCFTILLDPEFTEMILNEQKSVWIKKMKEIEKELKEKGLNK